MYRQRNHVEILDQAQKVAAGSIALRPAASSGAWWIPLLFGLCSCVPCIADEKSSSTVLVRRDEVESLLRLKCVKCHGSVNPKGKLNLTTLRGMARGGEDGAVAVPGSAEKSLLWQRVTADEMPPDAPLSADEKSLLRAWLESGASGLPTGNLGELVGADHWAFQPLRKLPPPEVKHTKQLRTSVDRWVQASLEPRGVSLASDADAVTLVRRVYLDLTGLPPTPEDVENFVHDCSVPGDSATSPVPGEQDEGDEAAVPNVNRDRAYAALVERLLASPQYGERWGKHWLDAAGYADSNGYFSADTDRPLAYRYRDYVIRSLNADKPFDLFLREQLAGDEMINFRPGEPTTPDIIEQLVATHFLRNGQDGTDIGVIEPEAFEIDRRAALEAVVQVTASSLMGLTLHCARCHDHKFEPITQKEYYQFQAIMFPAFNPQDWVNPKDRTVYAYLPGEKEKWEANEQRLKNELTELRRGYTEWLAAHREPADLLQHETFDDAATWKMHWSNTAPGDDHPGGQVVLDASTANAAHVVDGKLQVIAGPGEAWISTTASFDWTPENSGSWIQATFDLLDNKVGGGPAERIGYTIAAHDYDDTSARDGGNLLVDGNPMTATNIYRDYPGSDQKVLGQIGEQGYEPGRNYGVRVTNIGDGKFRLEHLVDGLNEGKSLELTAADLPDGGFAFFYCSNRSYVVDNLRLERSMTASEGDQPNIAELRKQLDTRRNEFNSARKKLESLRTSEPGRAIAWVTDKSAKPPEVPLLTRGLYHLRGPSVEPAALQILTDSGREFKSPSPDKNVRTTGRRMSLAEWLTRSDGRPAALVARVHANRIWRQYFGRGIVATTDNLGQSGSPPTHPELLDELAATLVENGWSQKSLHRLIVMSSAYRQSSAPRPEGLGVDPDNRYLWRWPMRRLEAEVIRDGMLAAAGQLDTTPYGPYVPTRQTPVGEVIVDDKAPGARRRSVYLQQRRSQTVSMLKLFDAPALATVCTTRPSSTVPLQSLALLNSEFAISCAEAMAKRLLAETDASIPQLKPDAQAKELVQRAWRVAIGREPSADEQSLGVEFLGTQRGLYTGDDAAALALADFCQMLLASNAFLYVE